MIFAYPVRDKQKSLDVCRAFMQGIGGQVVPGAQRLMPGPAFFYGIDSTNQHLWDEVRNSAAQTFFYCDNSYFDDTRQQYFRLTRGRLQHTGTGDSTGKRFEALGIEIKDMRAPGSHIVVCPQSEPFMQKVVKYRGTWSQDVLADLKGRTTRALRLRLWSGDKQKLASTLGEDLEGAHALITWSSAAAITAILSGIPAFCSPQCAAAPVANLDLVHINTPLFYSRDIVRRWANVLADNQWTLDEARDGLPWETLHA